MSNTHKQVLDIIKDWFECELGAKPVGFAGNELITLSSDCDECGDGSCDVDLHLDGLAVRIVAAIKDGRIVVAGKVPA